MVPCEVLLRCDQWSGFGIRLLPAAPTEADVKSKTPLETDIYRWSFDSSIRKKTHRDGGRMLESDHRSLVEFAPKRNSRRPANRPGKRNWMNDDTRLRDDLSSRGSSTVAVAARGTGPKLAPGAEIYAALDLGTNNCRLLIACPTEDGFRVVDSFSRIIRLGEGISTTGSISEAAMERAIAALSICRDKIHSKKARRLRLIATEACRAAGNADGFRERVAAQTGIRLEVIDRETEAALAVIGCSPLLDPRGRGAILFDIGGGSTELVRIERDPADDNPAPRIKAWMSIPLGVVTLAERFGGRDVTPEIYDRMVQEVAHHVTPFATQNGGDLSGMHLLGTSGTVTTLAGIHLN